MAARKKADIAPPAAPDTSAQTAAANTAKYGVSGGVLRQVQDQAGHEGSARGHDQRATDDERNMPRVRHEHEPHPGQSVGPCVCCPSMGRGTSQL